MKLLSISLFALVLTGTSFAQQWELGGAAGVGIYVKNSVTGNTQSADAGFKTGPAFSGFVVQNLYKHLAGQIRYTFQLDELQVSSGGTKATFSGQTHAVHYDLMWLAGEQDAKVRPYVLGGGGMKIYRGTGTETESQPLGEFAVLTRTQQVEPLITFGGGVRVKLGDRGALYLEARDYLTPFPKDVVAAVPPSKINGWVHDFVPMVSVSFGF